MATRRSYSPPSDLYEGTGLLQLAIWRKYSPPSGTYERTGCFTYFTQHHHPHVGICSSYHYTAVALENLYTFITTGERWCGWLASGNGREKLLANFGVMDGTRLMVYCY